MDEISAIYENTSVAFAWVLAVETTTATFEQMGAFSDKRDRLDAKLTQAINVMMTGSTSDLTKRIFNMKEKCIKEH
eukprot:10498628-Heterocapsa_arctica.AAC.1